MSSALLPLPATRTASAICQIVLALLCGAGYLLCRRYLSIAGPFPEFLPFSGIAIAMILLDKKQFLLGICGGLLLVQLGFDNATLWSPVLKTGGLLAEASAAAWLLKKADHFDLGLIRPKSFLYLYLVGLCTPAIGALFLLLALIQEHGALEVDQIATVNQYWMGDSLGIVLFVLLILLWRRPPRRWRKRDGIIEFAAVVILAFLLGQIIFLDCFHDWFGHVNRGYWMFLIVLVAAIRLGRHGVVVILIMTTLQAMMGAALGKGFFANDLQATHLVNLWNYIASLTLVGMAIAIVLKSREINERELVKSEAQLLLTQQLAGISSWKRELTGDRQWWSPGVYELFGRSPALGPAIYPEVRRYFTADSWQVLSAHIEQCALTGESFECDAEVTRPDGQRRWIISRGEADRDESGKIIGLHGTLQDITARKLTQLRLAASEANFRDLFENSPTAMISICAETGVVQQVNTHAINLFGYGEREFVTLKMIDITHPDDVAASQFLFESNARGDIDNIFRMEKRYKKSGGQYFWAETSIAVVKDETGHALYNIASVIDISARRKFEQEFRQLSLAVEQSPESIEITNTEPIIEYVNTALLTKTGYTREELIGQSPRILQSGKTPRATFESLWATLKRGEIWEGEFINRTKAGVEYTEHAIISPIRQSDGTITHYVAVKEDITEKIRSKKQIHRLAYFDDVTELPNFVMLQEHISQSIIKTRQAESYAALLTLNIDRFKMINDANGQSLSNVLLKSLGERLVKTLHATDVVSRISGDEFSILFPDLAHDLQPAAHLVMQISQKIHACMRTPFQIGGKELILTACHGIALFSGTELDSPYEVMRRANTALHHAKLHGCGQSVFFEDSLEHIVKQRFAIEGDLRQAIVENQLQVYLQSQVDEQGEIKGAEALIRWQHPRDGMISPIHFIPIAEETNLIIDIDNWVLNVVCGMISGKKIAGRALRFSVNISARHFNQADFVQQIRAALEQTGADPHMLTLEITEGIVIGNIDEVIAKMRELSAIGIHFSMDDFGTGYSSLSYLKRLPIHELKIDKSFIQEVSSDSNDAALVEVILSVARHLKLKVVAEGVETEEQADFLNRRARVLHQGYLFSRPEPMVQWIEKLN